VPVRVDIQFVSLYAFEPIRWSVLSLGDHLELWKDHFAKKRRTLLRFTPFVPK